MHTDVKTVVLGVTGSIAAYKAAEITSRLKKLGIAVRVILTEGGAHFITPLTLETLSLAPVHTDQFSRETPYEVEHIALAKQADVFLVAPASANFIGKAANGIADDLLTTTFLATKAPVLIAPAMNANMYAHPAVQANMQTLRARGAVLIAPEEGLLACGDVGKGRLAPVEEIVEAVLLHLKPQQDFAAKRIVVTAGPTKESIDPVRFISNRSSGKMGFAIAAAAAQRGAQVTLITGPTALATPAGVSRQDIVSSAQLLEAVENAFPACDALIMAAAPADFTLPEVAAHKIKKEKGEGLTLTLVPTADILLTIGRQKQKQLLVGFAAETRDIEQNAKEKLRRKQLDFIAANDVGGDDTGFAVDTNAIVLYDKHGGAKQSGLLTKQALADWLLDQILPAFHE